jgi:hypothetical protein
MEELMASLPPVVPGASPLHPALTRQTRQALMRGIGGTVGDSQPNGEPSARHAPSGLDLTAPLSQLDLAPGFALHTLRLRNR